MTPPPDLRVMLGQGRLPALDGLRACAVGVVLLYHAGVPIQGDLGVTAFFVLSGFLITWLLMKELAATGRISFAAFYRRRTARIFPAYYVFLTVSFLWDWLHHQLWTGGLLAAALLYAMNYYDGVTGQTEGAISHMWSLAVEEQFYLLWPLLLLWLARAGTRRVRVGLTVAILAVVVWRSFLYLVVDAGTAYVYNAFDCRFDSLAIGCLMAAWGTDNRFLAFAKAVARYPLLPLLTILGVGISRMLLPSTYHYTIGFTVDALLLGILILQLLQLTESPGWRLLESKPMRYLGRISYPIYLWHVLALGLAARVVSSLPARVVLGSMIVVVVASGSYYLIEKPFLRLRTQRAPIVPPLRKQPV